MDRAFSLIAYVFVFLAFFCLSTDIQKLNESKELMKYSIDLSTKAATLQVNTDPTKIAVGDFEIDNTNAKTVFLNYMSKNLNTDTTTIENCMVDYKAINTPGNYLNIATNKVYTITHPSFVAAAKYRFNGLLIKENIIIDNNFGSSQLYSK